MLQRYAYVPKLIASFVLSIGAWTVFGVVLNWILFFTLAMDRLFVGCNSGFNAGCGFGILKALMLLLGFPFLYLLLGKMWGLSRVLQILIKNHGTDLVSLVRPLILRAASKVDQKVGTENLQGAKNIHDQIDQKAPWIIRYIFNSLKGPFVQSVIAGEVNLKSEADVDAAMTRALGMYTSEKRARTKKLAMILFVLNMGFLLFL